MGRLCMGWSERAKEIIAVLCGIILTNGLMSCEASSNPDTTINRAYDWYVRTLKTGEDPLQRARTGLRPLATDRFLASLQNVRPDLESNALLDPQSFDARLGVEKVVTQGASATARVILTGHTVGRQVLNVFLVKEESGWKIDDVKWIDDGSAAF